MTQPGNDERIAAVRAGDDDAFADLVREHTTAAWKFASLLLRDSHEAEDAVQETFLRAHASLDRFRGDAPFRSWLLTICRRVCLDRLRRRRLDFVSLEDSVTPLATVDDPVLAVSIQAALTTLDPREREAFVLVDVLGHSRREVADIVGAPASTIRSRVARARAHLAAQLFDESFRAGAQ